MNICLDLFCNVTRQVKTLLNEPMGEIVHGHGTGQGPFRTEKTVVIMSGVLPNGLKKAAPAAFFVLSWFLISNVKLNTFTTSGMK